MLQGGEDNNRAAVQGLLDMVGPELLNKLQVRDCADTLLKDKIISKSDKEEIRTKDKQQGPITATRLLLEKLLRKSHRWTPELQQLLKKYGLNEIAKMFQGLEKISFTGYIPFIFT